MTEYYVLLETIEREISTPVFFRTHDEAFDEMKKRFMQAVGYVPDNLEGDTDEGGESLSRWSAYAETSNHDNVDWRIFFLNEEGEWVTECG